MSDPAPPQIFDRGLINRRLDRAWARAREQAQADFLLVRAAEDLRDRLSVVKRRFAFAADFGTPGPHGAAALAAAGQADCIIRVAPTEASLGTGGFLPTVGDLERLPAADGRLDLAVSLLALQTVNDLPGALVQMRRSLKDDGFLIAAMIGGETLTELRQSLTIAESEILGGASPRVAPFVDVRALGGWRSARAWRCRSSISIAWSSDTRTCSRFSPTCALWAARARCRRAAANPCVARSSFAPPPSTPSASPIRTVACARLSTSCGSQPGPRMKASRSPSSPGRRRCGSRMRSKAGR